VDRAYLGLLARLVDGSRRWAWAVLAAAVLVTAASSYFISTSFAIDTNTGDLLARDLPFRRLSAEFNRVFPQLSNNIVVVIDGQSAGLVRETARKLAHRLKRQPKHFRAVYRPGGGKFFVKNGLLYLSTDQLDQLSNRLSQAQPMIARLASDTSLRGLFTLLGQALAHNAQANANGATSLPGLGRVVTELDKTVRAANRGHFYQFPWQHLIAGKTARGQSRQQFILLTPKMSAQAARPYQPSISAVRRAIQSMHLAAARGVRVRLTGGAMIANDQLRNASNGTNAATVLSLVLVIIVLVLALRDWRMVLATLATLVNGLAWTTAFGLAAIGPFNLISISFAVLFVGLAVDFGIQFCMRYREEFHGVHNLPEALRLTGAEMGAALTLAATAAAISFFSFVPTSYAGIIDLGIIAGSSMFFALFANLTLLPALLTILDARPSAASLRRRLNFSRLPVRRFAWAITALAIVAGLVAIPFMLRVNFNFDPLALENPHAEAVKTFRSLLAHSQRSPYTIELLEPDLASAKRAAARVSKLDVVSQAINLASFIPENQAPKLAIIQRMGVIVPPFTLAGNAAKSPGATELRAALEHFRKDLVSWQRHNAGAALAKPVAALASALGQFLARFGKHPAQLKALEARIMGTLPGELKRLALSLEADKVTLKSLPPDLRARYLGPDGRARVQVFSNLNLNKLSALRRFSSAVRHVAPRATGSPVMLTQGGDAVIGAFRQATATAVILIIVLLLIILRHLLDTLLALAPLVLASLLTVATMQWVGMSFNLANIIVLPLLVGLSVAYGIYFVLRWRNGESMRQVLLSSTPSAIFFSALATMCSFGSLAISSDPAVSMLGLTLTIALGWVLICTLIVLPAILTLVARAEQPVQNP
jgi:hopanoid biosynthesis associated RND transporter like protein HpnN